MEWKLAENFAFNQKENNFVHILQNGGNFLIAEN